MIETRGIHLMHYKHSRGWKHNGWNTQCFMSICLSINETEGMKIRYTGILLWWLIREQEHRMMMRWENEYLRIGGNRCTRSSNYRIGFHLMIIEGYLVRSITKWLLSRITEPICSKIQLYPLKLVNEGRSVHSITSFNLTSHCQCVLVVVGFFANRLSIITRITPKSIFTKSNGL